MAIITHNDVAALTGRTYSTTQQTALLAHILAVEAFVRRTLLDWTEETDKAHAYDGNGTRYLWLRRYCAALDSVEVNGTAMAAADYRLVNGNMLQRLDGGVWEYDPDSIELTGHWGFDAESAPLDFKELLALLAAKSTDAYGTKEVTSESIGKVSFSYLQSMVHSDGYLKMLWDVWAPLGVV